MVSYEDTTSLSSIHSTLHNMFHMNQTSCWIMSGCFDHHSFHNDINAKDDQPSSITADIHRDSPSTVQSTYRPKVIDTFIFYNELSMLRLRYEMLRDVVDLFVMVEARQTHTGKPKPLHFELNKHLFPVEFLNKLLAVTIDLPHIPATTNQLAWENEHYQRDYITTVLSKSMNLDDRDIILHADVDEIYRPSTVHAILQTYSLGPPASNEVIHIGMEMFYYNLSCAIMSRMWLQPFAVTYGTMKSISKNELNWFKLMNDLRLNIPCHPTKNLFSRGGWHLSYFKSLSKIFDKLDAFAHTETNTEEVKKDALNQILKGRSVVQGGDEALYCRFVFS